MSHRRMLSFFVPSKQRSSPYINHFIQPDTIIPDPTSPQAWNRYGYVKNNPVNLNDPTGHSYAAHNPCYGAKSGYKCNRDMAKATPPGNCANAKFKYCNLYSGGRLDRSHFRDGVADWLIAMNAYKEGQSFVELEVKTVYKGKFSFDPTMEIGEFRTEFIKWYATNYQQKVEAAQYGGSSFNTEDIPSAVLGAAMASYAPYKHDNTSYYKDFLLNNKAYKTYAEGLFNSTVTSLGDGVGLSGSVVNHINGVDNHTGDLMNPYTGVYIRYGGFGGSPYPRGNPAFDLLNSIVYP